MKNIVKKLWFCLILVFLIAIIITIVLLNNNDGVGSAGISKEEFEQIKIGETTNFGVNKIIDQNHEWDNDEVYKKCVEELENSKENKKYTYKYKYYGEKGGYAIITLQADYSNGYYYNEVKVIKKEQFGLK